METRSSVHPKRCLAQANILLANINKIIVGSKTSYAEKASALNYILTMLLHCKDDPLNPQQSLIFGFYERLHI